MTVDLLAQVFEVCIIPLLGLLTTFTIKWIRQKVNKCDQDKYVKLLSDIIVSCVIATNQTYVDSLKAQGQFDTEAQKKAFAQTKEAVLALLTAEAKKVLCTVYEDLDLYITEQIEAAVGMNK